LIFSASAIMTPSGLGRLLSVTVTVTVAQFIPETRYQGWRTKGETW